MPCFAKKCIVLCIGKKNKVTIIKRKPKLCRFFCRTDDNRLVKDVVFRTMDGHDRRIRPSRERMNNIKE
jgi:hypothetical protein